MSVDEIYDNLDAALLEKLEEDNRFERKPPGVHTSNLGAYFSMHANTEPDDGIIAIGIEDNGAISGLIDQSPNRLNGLDNSGKIYCPEAKYKTKRLLLNNKKGERDFVLIIRACSAT
jgi:hypothetical protein